jgi:hypothetical protein
MIPQGLQRLVEEGQLGGFNAAWARNAARMTFKQRQTWIICFQLAAALWTRAKMKAVN